MFWSKLIIFLIISVVSQTKCHAREPSRHGRPSDAGDRAPHKNPDWTILRDDHGNAYKTYLVGKHGGDTAAGSDGGGSGGDGDGSTAVIREGDLIAVHGTRIEKLRHRRHRPTRATTTAKTTKASTSTTTTTTTPKPKAPTRVGITASERPSTDASDDERQTTACSGEDRSEDGTPAGPVAGDGDGETCATTAAAPSPAGTRATPADRRTTTPPRREKPAAATSLWVMPSSSSSSVSGHHHVVGPGEPSAAHSLLGIGLNDTAAPYPRECDKPAAAEASWTGAGENENAAGDAGNERVDSERLCDARDGLILLVENSVRFRVVVDSKRTAERQSVEQDGDGGSPAATRDDDGDSAADAECSETDEKPDDGFMSLLRIKKMPRFRDW